MPLSAKKARYGLIGHPVSHSLSPFIMNRAFTENAVDAMYVTCDVDRGGVHGVIEELRALGFRGANVTYPLKAAVLEVTTRVSPEVEVIGALNTLRFREDAVEGFNTDAPGTVSAIETFAGLHPKGLRSLIFGAGGAGRAAAFGLLEKAAGEVTFAVRDKAKGKEVVDRFRRRFPERAIGAVGMADGSRLAGMLESADIIINATPIGMDGYGMDRLVDRDTPFRAGQICFDFVYHPRQTDFLDLAKRRGARTLEGLTLLVAQAEYAFRIWTGKGFSLPKMYEAVTLHVG